MIKQTFAIALGTMLFAAPALAASVTSNSMHRMKLGKRMLSVHEMKMDDGSVVYGMSKSDLERLLDQRIRDFSSYGLR